MGKTAIDTYTLAVCYLADCVAAPFFAFAT